MTGPRRFEPPSSPAPDLVLATTDKQYYAVSTSYLRIHSHFFEDLFATAFTSPLHFDDFHNGLPSLTINARSATLDLVLPFVAQYAPPVAVPAMRFAALDSLIEAYPLADLWESTKAQNELRSALLGKAKSSTEDASTSLKIYLFARRYVLYDIQTVAAAGAYPAAALDDPFAFEETIRWSIEDERVRRAVVLELYNLARRRKGVETG